MSSRNINNRIKVTIGFPVYNVEKYVEKSLLSVLSQKFSYDYEIIIVDDCGSDGSMDIVNSIVEYSKQGGGNIRIIKQLSNKGVAEARNTIIWEAKGDYIFFLDSDDWMADNCLATLYDIAIRNDTDVVVGSFTSVLADGDVIGQFIGRDTEESCDGAGVEMVNKGIDWQVAPWNKLYKTEFLRKNKIYFHHKLFEDVFFDFQIRVYANRICCTSENTLFYVARDNSLTSISQKKPSDEAIINYANIVNDIGRLTQANAKISGIFDYYMKSLRFIFIGVNSKKYSKQQKAKFNAMIKGYVRIIPSLSVLKSNTHKVLYVMSKIHLDHITFLKTYDLIEKWRRL